MRNKLVVLFIVGITIVAAVASLHGRAWVAEALEKGPFVAILKAEPIPLDAEEPGVGSVGALTYVGGWALTSENDDVGGFSGLVVDAEGQSIVAINDKGDWLTADFDINSNEPFSAGLIHPFSDEAVARAKIKLDAESLIRDDTGFLVSFEQEHRIVHVDEVGGAPTLTAHNNAVNLDVLSDNGGIEAMSRLADGRLLLFAEKGLDQQGTLPAWIVSEERSEPLRFAPPNNYSPTDAATLPSGDVLLLLRHFSQIDGVSVKVLLIKAEELVSGVPVVGSELAHIAPPQSVDNMEALDFIVLPDGTVRLFMLSDDNFNPLQRTLFLVFDWKPAAAGLN